ncbi:hypothetical protein [Streptococcus oralis]|uniref:hypothetical protein n=1 Tax=Streptococcus oralis TaxID=1303 RepID=UPI001EFDAE37|nr:hypothetical protein [Streptococcus oralis]
MALYQKQFNELHQLVKTYATLLETDIALMADSERCQGLDPVCDRGSRCLYSRLPIMGPSL